MCCKLSHSYSVLVIEYWKIVILSLLLAWPATALTGPECLVVSQQGDAVELQDMLSQHSVDQLFRVRDSSGKGLLHFCLRRGEEYWRPLLEAGWPVAKETGWTPQHEACLLGNLVLLQALQERGAGLEVKEPVNGGTPLHVACFNGHFDIVKFLVAKGAKVNARDNDGWTPLSQARDQGFPKIVDWLKKNGATR